MASVITGRTTMETALEPLQKLAACTHTKRAGKPINDTQLADWGDWCVTTCLLFGTSPETAHSVAAAFVAILRRDCT